MSADTQFDTLARELRRLSPTAPPAVRERVAAIAARAEGESARPDRVGRISSMLTVRRALTVGLPACLALLFGAALVHERLSPTSRSEPQALKQQASRASEAPTPIPYAPFSGRFIPGPTSGERSGNAAPAGAGVQHDGATATGRQRAASLPPSGTRLQAYDANLRIRVRDNAALSSATRRAMRVARGLGGYVASVSLNTPGREGSAVLTLRIPIGRVQEAVARFSELGTLVAQQFRVHDLQRQVSTQQIRIAKLRGRRERLEQALRRPLSAETRSRLQAELAGVRSALTRLTRAREQAIRRGKLARVTLALTTRNENAAVPEKPGVIGRALQNARAVLAKEIAWILYALVVLAPLLLVAAVAIPAARLVRRRSDRVLLERP